MAHNIRISYTLAALLGMAIILLCCAFVLWGVKGGEESVATHTTAEEPELPLDDSDHGGRAKASVTEALPSQSQLGIEISTEVDALEALLEIAAGDVDSVDEMIKFYVTLVDDPSTKDTRKRILTALSHIKDPQMAEYAVLEAIRKETRITADGFQLSALSGSLIAGEIWGRGGIGNGGNPHSVALAQGRLVSEEPNVQHSLMTALLVFKPEGLARDLVRTFENSSDFYLRLNILNNIGLTSDGEAIMSLAHHALESSLSKNEDFVYARAALRSLSKLVRENSSYGDRAVQAALKTVAAPGIDATTMEEAIDLIKGIDKKLLKTLPQIVQSSNANIIAMVRAASSIQ